MNLDFSDDQKFLQEEARKFLEKEKFKSVYFHERDHQYSLTDLKSKIMRQMITQNKEK